MSPNSEAVAEAAPTVTAPRVTVTPYRAADGREMVLLDPARVGLDGVTQADRVWEEYETLGPGWTLRVDGVVVGCAGIVRMRWPGVAHAWLLPSPDLPRYPKTMALAILQEFKELLARERFWRLECNVLQDFALGRRFAEWCGFQEEGILYFYGPKAEHMIRYALIYPEHLPDAVRARLAL